MKDLATGEQMMQSVATYPLRVAAPHLVVPGVPVAGVHRPEHGGAGGDGLYGSLSAAHPHRPS
jgi:hypothetical protein